ncbi:olfactory receptor 1f45-like [Aquarana catesbeiana]|uniref:olfactory receptor 1f45-like n=1 Tax=Aquarana catesbeiana TaxID=8400 RepID=UPI003CC93084
MGNLTSQSEFILLGLSDLGYSQIPVFLLIFLFNVATLAVNLLIISLVISDSHLHTPMYFFLGNLSVLDIFNSSISVLHVYFDIFTGNRLISYPFCISQVFFFSWFCSTECFILDIMSYDRYVAICHPLHYTTMINIPLCVKVAFLFWVLSFACCLLHTLYLLRLAFPDPTTIPSLFCELYELLQLSSSDTYLNYFLIYFQAACFSVPGVLVTFLSYVYIFKTILKITMKDGRGKAYSTCTSHLTVVFIFYGALFFNYCQPKTKIFLAGRWLAVFYTVVTPLLNPIIYSLRNRDLMGALQKTLSRIVPTP